ncbi:DUF2809 domain-containing protein [Mucilaginibacter lacusdianchii]|uniref:ribosomal maturation YjgA family protein n=1 Tax=Mucilaginibacter lacusdianchii TaxID=2684211 RepID=UPI00131A6845|nr:DUF2809 domain-containing protein [Mucilaginibacter sp. JXJ CY 39]
MPFYLNQPGALKQRVIYSGLALLTITLGLLSRHYSIFPLWIGSALWGLMVYYIVRFISPAFSLSKAAICSLAFSYAIEIFQLYQAPWINAIRQTLFGRLVLGQGFEWGDLAAYTLGIAIGLLGDKWANR